MNPTSEARLHDNSKSPDVNIQDGSRNDAMSARLKEVEARERAINEQQARDEEDKGREAKQQEALRLKVSHASIKTSLSDKCGIRLLRRHEVCGIIIACL